jgi:cyanate permease
MGWRDVLLAYSGMAVVVCGLWWALGRSAVKSTSEFQLKNFAAILKDKYVWVLLFFMIASMGSYDTLATWMPKVLEMKELNMTLASLLPLGFFLAGPIVGFASDRFRDRKAIIFLLGIVAAASIAVPAEHERLSASVGGVIGLISSLGNIGPLVMPVVFGFLIDVTGTFQVSVVSVAVLAGVTFTLGSRVRELNG